MASEKPTMILQSKSDMTREEIAVLSNAEAWRVIYSIRSNKAKDKRLQICFSGFGASKKEELISLAEESNFNVMSGVTNKLDYLIGGANAGPKKIEKAETQGVQFLTEHQFLELIETGEIPHAI